MNLKKVTLAISLLLCGVSFVNAQTLRSLAAERGRYVGSILNSEWFNNGLGSNATTYESIHKAQFNVVVAENEMKFDALEPSKNTFSWTKADKLMTYAEANGMRVRGHALAWHSQVPSWVSNSSWTRTTLLAVLKNHITTVVTHYKGRIQEWDVVNEAIDGSSWRTESIWYKTIGADFIDSAFVWAHAADPSAELYYNDYGIEWGTGNNSKAGFLLTQCQKWKNNGIPITGVGTQTHIANTHTGTPANVKALATALKNLGMTLQITELDIGFNSGTTPTASDLAAQGHLYAQFMDLFLEATNMKSLVIWGFTDKYSWLPSSQSKDYGLIYDKSMVKKPAYDSLMASLNRHAPSTVITPGTSSSSMQSSSSSAPVAVLQYLPSDVALECTVYNAFGTVVKNYSTSNVDNMSVQWLMNSENLPKGLYIVQARVHGQDARAFQFVKK